MDNSTLETIFFDYLNNTPKTAAEQEVRQISIDLDAQIAAGSVDEDRVADYELACRRAGFYAGFAAARQLMAQKAA